MATIKGTVKNRQGVVDIPADWPEGIEVEITPVPPDVTGGQFTQLQKRDRLKRAGSGSEQT